jgi:hypothetical protein
VLELVEGSCEAVEIGEDAACVWASALLCEDASDTGMLPSSGYKMRRKLRHQAGLP